jgi:dihydropteroate synthase
VEKSGSVSGHTSSKRFVLRGKALSVSAPAIMGVLNVTPDSFSDGGEVPDVHSALDRVARMVGDGARLIDVGGESTRPGSDPVAQDVELRRVIPVLEKAIPDYPEIMFSIDTTKYEVARRALECGAHMVNDVSGLQKDPRLADLCSRHRAALVIMHSQGPPKTMQQKPQYGDAVSEIASFLKEKAELAEKAGVEQVIIDPGIGFGKTLEHNLELIAKLSEICRLGYPVLVGASRKSMIGKLLADVHGERPVNKRLAGTLALHYHALLQGAAVLRVHDVREARDTLEVFNALSSVL